jgi:hypothetical protein
MRVMASKRGYYGETLRRERDVFTLRDASDFNDWWMLPVADDVPERHETAQQALARAYDEGTPFGNALRSAGRDDDANDRALIHDDEDAAR